MRTVSDAFLNQIQASHTLAVEATVAGTDVPITDGSVTQDQTAAARSRCDLTVVDDGTLGLVPTGPSSLLAPYGNEIQIKRGVQYADGTRELVGLGVFRLQEVDVDSTADGLEIRISGLDRSARFTDARFEEPYSVAPATNYVTAILDVLLAAWPEMPHRVTDTALTTPALFAQEGDDRWQFAQDMAKAISMRLYFDGDGVLTLVPDILSGPVITIAEGTRGVLITAGRTWKREGTFNRVIATGENTGESAPARGVATDENPASPTYYYGPFGRAPRFYSSPFLTTDDQAASAARSILDRELGTTEQVRFGSLVLPHLETGDTVRITRQSTGIDEDHVLDTLTIPLAAAGAMAGQTRARQIT